MKIGLITKKEKYWSLCKINESIVNCLKKKFGIMSICLGKNMINNQKLIDKLYKKCDIVIYTSSKLITFTRIKNKPTFFLMHAWMDHAAGINIFINRKTFKRNDSLLFSSTAAKNKFNQVYSTNLHNTVIPYFTTNQQIKLKRGEKEYLRAKYKIPKDTKLIIYFGRFSREKNIEVIFDIAKKLKYKKFIILLIGDFTTESTFGFGQQKNKYYKEKIEKLINNGKNEKILIIKKINSEELNKLMSIAFLSINPTTCLEEDFGLSAIESMSAGLPIIASNWGGLKDIISGTQDGYLMKTCFSKKNNVRIDIGGAVKYIDKLLSNEIIRNKISSNVLARYNKLFSEKAFLKNIDLLIINTDKNLNKVDTMFIYPKNKYELIYKSALKYGTVETIYLDNPNLFRDLYKNYLGNKKI